MEVWRSLAIAGKPGKYMSMENGLIVERAPKIRIIIKCCRRVINSWKRYSIEYAAAYMFVPAGEPVVRVGTHSVAAGISGCNSS
ncbi:hypothetical protein GCM10027085_60630 [Spirosoma aerophilum]